MAVVMDKKKASESCWQNFTPVSRCMFVWTTTKQAWLPVWLLYANYTNVHAKNTFRESARFNPALIKNSNEEEVWKWSKEMMCIDLQTPGASVVP